MASIFTSAAQTIGTSNNSSANIYTCASDKKAVIHALYISNTNETLTLNVNIAVTVAGGGTFYYVGSGLSIDSNNTLVLDKPINLQSNDIIRVWADVAGGSVYMSILEVT
jgi:hypothetical protein